MNFQRKPEKRVKSIRIAYRCILILVIAFLVFINATSSDDVYMERPDMGYEVVPRESFTVDFIEDDSLPASSKTVLTLPVDSLGERLESLSFYVVHSEVTAYIDDELILSVTTSKGNKIGRTPGNNWLYLFLNEMDHGKTIRIEITPVYASSVGVVPTLYHGTRLSVLKKVLTDETFGFIMGAMAFVMGVIVAVIALYTKRYQANVIALYYLSVFSILLGIWKNLDLMCTAFFLPYSAAAADLAIFCIYLMPIPFLLFAREFFRSRKNNLVFPLCWINLGLLATTLLLQAFNLVDIRELLTVGHVVVLMTAFGTIINAAIDIHEDGWTKDLKLASAALGFAILGTAIDLVLFYKSGGVTSGNITILGFLIYILVLTVHIFRELVVVIETGRHAQELEEMATIDSLTGMYSRNAYMKMLSEPVDKNAKIVAVMFDLNNLKYYNDTYGHEAGDIYLKSSAEDIKKYFEPLGDCFRIGGDEFCALIHDVSLSKVQEAMVTLKKKMEIQFLQHPGEFPYYIAMGSAQFDPEEDLDLHGTMRRADRAMYRDKIASKERGSASGKI